MLKMDNLTGNDYRFAMFSKGLTVVRTLIKIKRQRDNLWKHFKINHG